MRLAFRGLRAALAALVASAMPTAPEAQPLRIVPTLVDCIEVGRAATIVASFRPADRLARARLYFRSGGTRAWYSVEMRPQGNRMVGWIPPPRVETVEVEYFLEAVDREARAYRTAPFKVRVVSKPSDCTGRVAGAISEVPALVFGVEGGAPALPAGFRAEGLAEAPGNDTVAVPAATERRVESASDQESPPVGPAAPSGGGGGFPVKLALLGAGGAAAAAIVVSGFDDSGTSAGREPAGSIPGPTPTPPPGDGLSGQWAADVVEVGTFDGLLCKWASAVLFEFRVGAEGEITGLSTTTTTTSSAAACGGREPLGQPLQLRGRSDGVQFSFVVEAIAFELEAPSYEGALQEGAIAGAVRRDTGTEGNWTAQRR